MTFEHEFEPRNLAKFGLHVHGTQFETLSGKTACSPALRSNCRSGLSYALSAGQYALLLSAGGMINRRYLRFKVNGTNRRVIKIRNRCNGLSPHARRRTA